MSTDHYLIHATDVNGEDLGLLVEANNTDEAVTLWRKWLKENEYNEPDGEVVMFLIPALQGHPRVCAWYDQAGVTMARSFKA